MRGVLDWLAFQLWEDETVPHLLLALTLGIVIGMEREWRQRTAGLRTASLWATVPSYVPGAPSPKAALALVERTAAMLGTWVATTDLEIASASYERQVSELVQADEETIAYVASLEERHDDDGPDLTDGGSIADEIERFLREHPGG